MPGGVACVCTVLPWDIFAGRGSSPRLPIRSSGRHPRIPAVGPGPRGNHFACCRADATGLSKHLQQQRLWLRTLSFFSATAAPLGMAASGMTCSPNSPGRYLTSPIGGMRSTPGWPISVAMPDSTSARPAAMPWAAMPWPISPWVAAGEASSLSRSTSKSLS